MSQAVEAAASAGAYAEPASHLRWRHLKDALARRVVGIGGVAVLGSLLLIFVYLLVEVLPLFASARADLRAEFHIPGDGTPTLRIALEEQSEIGLRVAASGEATFFDLATGSVRKQSRLPTGDRTLAAVVQVAADKDELAAVLSDGSVLPFKHSYAVSYPGDKRVIDPSIEFPRGEVPLPFMNELPRSLVVRKDGDRTLFAGVDSRSRIHLRSSEATTNILGETTVEQGPAIVFEPRIKPDLLLVNPLLEWLYVVDTGEGRIALYRLGAGQPELVSTESVGAGVRHARFLSGGISVLTADAAGLITQWFPARRAETTPEGDAIWYLARVREMQAPAGDVTVLSAEQRRRGFAVGTSTGRIGLYHATAQRQLLEFQAFDGPVSHLAFDPRANTLLALGADGTLKSFALHNEYPEVSWSSLWGKVWYESYDEPRYLWQSSAATNDFEPKFSLSPLTLGTIKGALYAMIFAVPLAVLGAIFTANFMAPPMRQVVKPTVEVMQALPTVVLGFLAGLWLAPFVEANLPGVFLTLILLPLAIPVAGYAWVRMPARVRYLVPEGWEALLLVPVVLGVVWLCFVLAKPVEVLAFGGNMQAWMDQTLGIGYDQRNCLVVGIAMGVAVIPGIFSIAEDAIFSVPKQLTLGSLALGATPWQTLVGVVLPTASPGIFSAVMIGMGRAVGETMIVLMATGNTAVMDFSMFSGMRTLSANVAVEMPESEVGSTHFRLLFLAGLVLFVFTFAINTLAEVVRQRLREKYGNL
ncbi:MAG: ABC transporter permease subunit [Gammaproteobacteria bacterium]